jgi:hypothetical protein
MTLAVVFAVYLAAFVANASVLVIGVYLHVADFLVTWMAILTSFNGLLTIGIGRELFAGNSCP